LRERERIDISETQTQTGGKSARLMKSERGLLTQAHGGRNRKGHRLCDKKERKEKKYFYV